MAGKPWTPGQKRARMDAAAKRRREAAAASRAEMEAEDMAGERPVLDEGQPIFGETNEGVIDAETIAAMEEMMAAAETQLDSVEKAAVSQIEQTAGTRSLITNNGRPMPAKMPLWKRTPTGMQRVWASTNNVMALMAKRVNGQRIFFHQIPVGEREPDYIDAICEICKRAWGSGGKFLNHYDLDSHRENYHPQEFQAERYAREQDERRQEREEQRRMTEAMLELARNRGN